MPHVNDKFMFQQILNYYRMRKKSLGKAATAAASADYENADYNLAHQSAVSPADDGEYDDTILTKTRPIASSEYMYEDPDALLRNRNKVSEGERQYEEIKQLCPSTSDNRNQQFELTACPAYGTVSI